MDSTIVQMMDGLAPLISMFTGSEKLAMVICSVIAGFVSGLVRAGKEQKKRGGK